MIPSSTDKTGPHPPCPRCQTAKRVYPHGERNFQCDKCGAIFDGQDDGTVGYGDPARFAERKERHQQRRAK
jgi:ribosomal protein L37AE/L43A